MMKILMLFLLIFSPVALGQDLFVKMGQRYSVEPNVLRAISQIESSQHPWTLNVYGEPFFLTSKKETLHLLQRVHKNPYLLKVTFNDNTTRRFAYPSRKAANRKLSELSDVKKSNIRHLNVDLTDIGIMQINWHYHHENVPGIERLLDPEYNIAYGAFYLSRLLKRYNGDLLKAIASYHDNDPVKQKKYVRRFKAVYDSLK